MNKSNDKSRSSAWGPKDDRLQRNPHKKIPTQHVRTYIDAEIDKLIKNIR